MTDFTRPIIIAGNWKMYKTTEEARAFVKELAPKVGNALSQVFLAVPFTSIKDTADAAKDSRIVIGAQNMNDANEGAFTGEIAARMLLDVGARFVILGHSERRHLFHESNAFINKKVLRALADGIRPILCVGEKLDEREQGNTEQVVKDQLSACLDGVTKDKLNQVILAYEPVWAIGTGLNATPDTAQQMHSFCRRLLADMFGQEIANKVLILYGGSVKPENARTLMLEPDIDGLLVGGASLSVDAFSKIVNFQNM